MTDKKVLVIGGGVGGLTAALELAQSGIGVELVEQTGFMGGHAIQYTCKAVERCVNCGACLAEKQLEAAAAWSEIHVLRYSRVTEIKPQAAGYTVAIAQQPVCIDPERCNNCGVCLKECPSAGAIVQSFSGNDHPMFAFDHTRCLYFKDQSCRLCESACLENAIDLGRPAQSHAVDVDAIVVTTGFSPFDPVDKPYGYGIHANVITNLELERIMRRHGQPLRPSDQTPPERIAFIQCVGSRDAVRNHLWCSKYCCGSSLRMARVIKTHRADAAVTVFYIDLQTFMAGFDRFLAAVREQIELVRAIPADIFAADNDRLKVSYFDQQEGRTQEQVFDLVVLAVGITPNSTNPEMAKLAGLTLSATGFLRASDGATDRGTGVFVAGTAQEPMSIPETIANAGLAVCQVKSYLGF